MRKKVISMILVTVVALTLLIGCSEKGGDVLPLFPPVGVG